MKIISRQVGLTLVELMIALAVGAILILGVIQIFLSGQRSYQLQDGVGTMQDGGRIGIFFLHEHLRMAGFPRRQQLPPGFFSPFVIADDPAVAGVQPLTRDGNDAVNEPDTVTIMYRSNTNCVGGDTSAYTNPMQDAEGFFYAKDQFLIGRSVLGDGTSAMSLRCQALDANDQLVTAAQTANTEAFVEGIEDMQLLYGVDRPPAGVDPDFLADAYLNATQVTAANLWNSVVSIRFALLVTSIDNAMEDPSPIRHRLLDAPAHPAFADRLYRRVFRSTVEVRNRTP